MKHLGPSFSRWLPKATRTGTGTYDPLTLNCLTAVILFNPSLCLEVAHTHFGRVWLCQNYGLVNRLD